MSTNDWQVKKGLPGGPPDLGALYREALDQRIEQRPAPQLGPLLAKAALPKSSFGQGFRRWFLGSSFGPRLSLAMLLVVVVGVPLALIGLDKRGGEALQRVSPELQHEMGLFTEDLFDRAGNSHVELVSPDRLLAAGGGIGGLPSGWELPTFGEL